MELNILMKYLTIIFITLMLIDRFFFTGVKSSNWKPIFKNNSLKKLSIQKRFKTIYYLSVVTIFILNLITYKYWLVLILFIIVILICNFKIVNLD